MYIVLIANGFLTSANTMSSEYPDSKIFYTAKLADSAAKAHGGKWISTTDYAEGREDRAHSPSYKFSELEIGDTFDFISPRIPGELNTTSFYERCTKVSARKYGWTDRHGPFTSTVGSANVTVYNVKRKGT